MLRGIYTAAMGMLIDMARLDNIANDLANVDTVGYRSDRMAFKTYLSREMYALVPRPDLGKVVPAPLGKLEGALVVDEVRPDMEMGILERTGRPIDLALSEENAFFAVDFNGKRLYTRAGNFKLDEKGYLVTPDGAYLLDVSGKPIKFSAGYTISKDGRVHDPSGRVVAEIGVYSFERPEKLEKFGYTYFRETPLSGRARPTRVGIMVGYVERSNVNAVREMVKMIDALRHFEIGQRVITTSDELLGRLLNNVAALR